MVPPHRPFDPEQPTSAGLPPPSAPLTPASTGPHAATEPAPFRTGDTIAGRYRIVTALGKGGMGEVYRADDLELAQPVALKFLPAAISADGAWLDRFRAEVRLTRQISHPNVCRVYDIATDPASGRVFLSMEFIDGEDLASLLRRIGRLPPDKGVEIARQICFGLAAAHAQGVAHRDLKPANIMLDGRGRARVTDFGIAAPIQDLPRLPNAQAGTPRYMAPEQLAGRHAGPRSDIYSLGLVLFEIFTGRPAFEAHKLDHLREIHGSGARAPDPSSIIADLDPACSRLIRRCLEPDPAHRPASAMAVVAALPGADPLQAALAAGETPSPELIAASGSRVGLSVRAAALLLLGLALSAAVLVAVTAPYALLSWAEPHKSAEALADRARGIASSLGFNAAPAEERVGVWIRSSLVNRTGALRQDEQRRVLAGQPGPYFFWLRQSPTPLEPVAGNRRILPSSPYPSIPGELIIRTDTSGRLESLLAVPPQRLPAQTTTPQADPVPALFAAAGLDLAAFTPAPPTRRAPVDVDSLRAWTGPGPADHQPLDDSPQARTVTVHAGLADGRPVFFAVAAPWSDQPAGSIERRPMTLRERLAVAAFAGFIVLIAGGMLALGVRNVRSGRGDVRGATRVALVVGLATVVSITLVTHRFPSLRDVFFNGTGYAPALWVGCMFWLFYIAMEPAARRYWPQSLVSWSRLVAGRLRDPLVGRDALLGFTLGLAGAAVAWTARLLIDIALGAEPRPTLTFAVSEFLSGPRLGVIVTLQVLISAIMFGSGALLAMVLGRALFKSQAGALTLTLAVLLMGSAGNLASGSAAGLVAAATGVVPVLALVRLGMLAGVCAFFALFLSNYLIVGLDWSSPWAAPAWIPAGFLAFLALAAAAAAIRPADVRA